MAITVNDIKLMVGKNTVASAITRGSITDAEITSIITYSLTQESTEYLARISSAIQVIDAITEPESFLNYTQGQRSVDRRIIYDALIEKRKNFQKEYNDNMLTELSTVDMITKDDDIYTGDEGVA